MDTSFQMHIARADGNGLFDSSAVDLTILLDEKAPDGLRPVGWITNHLLVPKAYWKMLN
jgi:hypothetical protein